MNENRFVGNRERVTGEVETQSFEVLDTDEKARFSVDVTNFDVGQEQLLEDMKITAHGDSLDVLKELGIEKGTYTVEYISNPGEATASVHGVRTPQPTSPMNTLIFIHELSHVAQTEEYQIESDGMIAHTRELMNVLRILNQHGIELAEIGISEEIEQFDSEFASLLRLPEDDPMKRHDVNALARKWTDFVRQHPVLEHMRKLYVPLIEQDAHRRTNELLTKVEEDLDISFDFASPDKTKTAHRDDVDKSMYERAYEILGTRKQYRTFGPGLTMVAMCKEAGVPVNIEALPDDLSAHIETQDFQDALTQVRMQIKGYNNE